MRIHLPTLAHARTWLFLAFFTWIAIQNAQAQCPVNAAFTSSSVYVCQGSTVNFTNLSTGGVVFQGWFENGVNFALTPNASRTFNTPGQYLISLVASNGSCQDTANTILIVDSDVTATTAITPVQCFGFSNGAVNLTPAGGTPNISIDNDRAANNWTAINSVSQSSFTNGYSIECWAKPRGTWTTSDGMIVAFNKSDATNRVLFGYNAGTQRFVYFDDLAGNRFQTGTAARGVWHHVVITMNTSRQLLMYVNGTQVLSYTTPYTTQLPVAGDFVSIGQEFDAINSTSQHFDGQLDEVRIWNTVLTPATITSNYNSCGPLTSAHPNSANLVAYYSMNEGSGSFLFDRSGLNNHGTRVLGSTWATPALTNYGCFNPGTGYAYNWSTGATTEDLSGRAAGTYSYTITDGGGCTEVGSATVTEPGPVVIVPSAVPNDSICLGDTTVLSATGAATYTWTPAATLSASTGSSVNSFPGITTDYTITGTDAAGCVGTVSYTVTVLPLPTAAITGSSVLCFGDTISLTASGALTYTWSSGDSTDTANLSPASTTTYSVTATDQYGCQDTAQYPVLVNPLPTVSITGNDTICVGDSTTLTASGGTGYFWSIGDFNAAITVAPAASLVYDVLVTDGNGCQNTDSIAVTVNALPVITFTGNTTICIGDTALVNATGGSTYSWSNGDTLASISVAPSGSTTYAVTVSDANTCVQSDSVLVTVNMLPTVIATGGDTICFGDSVNLGASGANTYLWSNGAPFQNVTVFPPNSSAYTVIGTDTNGCSNTDSVFVLVNALPAPTISGPSQICDGASAQFIAAGGNNYVWSTGDLTASLLVTPPVGTYTYGVTVTDGNLCSNTSSIGLSVVAIPTAAIAGGTAICAGGSANLTASGGGTYAWNTAATTAAIAVTPSSTATYTVTVTNANGCTDTASASVVVNPNPATPGITQAGSTLSAPVGFASYQWLLGGSQIAGATSQTYSPSVVGFYTVIVTDANGCSSTSNSFEYRDPTGLPGLQLVFGDAQIYPNPSQGSFSVLLNLDRNRELSFVVSDIVGHVLLQRDVKANVGPWEEQFTLDGVAKGVYLLQIRSGAMQITRKVVVE
jgi:Concanavalin A-like lectin/glucanases superfamily/Secretion system C-terminal sorting domain